MPSDPDGFVSHPQYAAEFGRARSLLLGHPGRWRIIYHYDGDGIAGASSAVRALARLGFEVQASPLVGVERGRMEALLRSSSSPVLIVDTGASWLDAYAAHPHPVVVLDHHQYAGAPTPPALPDHVAMVNPIDWGVDGMSELCGATLAWLFTLFLDPANWDNAPWGLSGAIAARQHVGGFKGLNRRLVEAARLRGELVASRGLAWSGPTLEAALSSSVDPFYRGLSGRPDAARAFLRHLSLEPTRPPATLTTAEEEQLAQALRGLLAQQGARPEFCELVVQERWTFPGLGPDAAELARLQNATGREGEPSVGLGVALGDAQCMTRAQEDERAWRDGVMRGLRRIEDGGVESLSALQWFESPETTLAGTQAGLAMNYLLDARRPVFVFTNGGPHRKVSARGTTWLVNQGLDLATTCRTAAAQVGGEGGGHRVASGATIPTAARDEFLEHANRTVARQLHRDGGSA